MVLLEGSNMSVVIVGNGLGCLNKENGAFVDTCDTVLRIGRAVTKGYERYVGTKMDIYYSCLDKWPFETTPDNELAEIKELLGKAKSIWISNELFSDEYANQEHDNKSLQEQIVRYKKMSFYFERYSVNKSKVYSLHESIIRYQKLLSGQLAGNSYVYPTSGYSCIESILELYPNQSIYIMGFDGFRSGWYWDNDHTFEYKNYSLIQESLNIRKHIREKRLIKLD